MLKPIITLFVSVCMLGAFAQDGKINGIVKDAQTGELLTGASVFIEGTTIGAMTDFNGQYALYVPPGEYEVTCSFISYGKKTSCVNLDQGTDKVVNFDLGESVVKLDDINVVAQINRASEKAIMMLRKDATTLTQAIGAQLLSTQGVSEVATAATKITGITMNQENSRLNIRGLGDRYNNTSLNGLPFPSNNAELKNVDLSIFSMGIVQSIEVNKNGQPNLYGNFSGADINIVSKAAPDHPFLQIGTKVGVNSNYIDVDQFYLPDGISMWGFDNFRATSSLNEYNFETNWNRSNQSKVPNIGVSVAGGTELNLIDRPLRILVSASFDNNYNHHTIIERRINGSNFVRKELEGETYSYSTQTTAMASAEYQIDQARFAFHSILLNSSEAKLKELQGFIFDLAEEGALVRRSDFERTTILSNQLLGGFAFGSTTNLSWGASYNKVNNRIPDRKHVTLDGEQQQMKHFTDDNESDYFRYFHHFNENEYAINIKLEQKRGVNEWADHDWQTRYTLGYNGRYKTRAFESTQFNHDIYRNRNFADPNYFVNVDVDDIDAFLNKTNLRQNQFYLKTFFGNTIRPSTYDGVQLVNGIYFKAEHFLSREWLLMVGGRLETIFQEVEFETPLATLGDKGEFSELRFLPSLSVRYQPTAKHNLRFAMSSGYTLPQFTEMALFQFEGITETTVGNPYLEPSTIYNAELGWEYFPSTGGMFALSAFAKYIVDPINRIVMTSASNDYTYANTGDWGTVAGIELEVNRKLLAGTNYTISFIGNCALMYTNQELNNEKVANDTRDENGNSLINVNFNDRELELQGAAPLLLNSTLTYEQKLGSKTVILSGVYGYTSDKLYLIGTNTYGNQWDHSNHSLDAVAKLKIKHFETKLSVKNILNSEFSREQRNRDMNHTVRSYSLGSRVSVSLNYTF